MPLTPGTRLGHYQVTALIGEGGMGQVWQVTDIMLSRQVDRNQREGVHRKNRREATHVRR